MAVTERDKSDLSAPRQPITLTSVERVGASDDASLMQRLRCLALLYEKLNTGIEYTNGTTMQAVIIPNAIPAKTSVI